jgi:hypothetical protein
MNNQILVFNSLVHLNYNQVLLRVKLKNLLGFVEKLKGETHD